MNWSAFWFILFCMMFGLWLGERHNNADASYSWQIINSGYIVVILDGSVDVCAEDGE